MAQEMRPERSPAEPPRAVWGMWAVWLIILLGLLIVTAIWPRKASAQSPERAATRMADAIQPTSVKEVAECIVTLATVLPVGEAKATCLAAQTTAVGESKKLANETADATQKNRWPQAPVWGGWTGGWPQPYYGAGWGVNTGGGGWVTPLGPPGGGRRH